MSRCRHAEQDISVPRLCMCLKLYGSTKDLLSIWTWTPNHHSEHEISVMRTLIQRAENLEHTLDVRHHTIQGKEEGEQHDIDQPKITRNMYCTYKQIVVMFSMDIQFLWQTSIPHTNRYPEVTGGTTKRQDSKGSTQWGCLWHTVTERELHYIGKTVRTLGTMLIEYLYCRRISNQWT